MNRSGLANIITTESLVDYTKEIEEAEEAEEFEAEECEEAEETEETKDISVNINDWLKECPVKLTKKQKDSIMSLLQ